MFQASVRLRAALILAASTLLTARTVHAAPLPLESTVTLGRPAHAITIKASAGEQLSLQIGARKRTLPARSASDLTIERVAIGSHGAVAVLRVQAANGAWVGLVGGLRGDELLLFEPAELRGDPGERRATELQIAKEPASLSVGVRIEGLSLCGRPVLLEPRELDPTSLTLVRERGKTSASELPATSEAQRTQAGAPPSVALLEAVSSSELDPTLGLPRSPRALVDGDNTSGVRLTRGDFVLFRWICGAQPIQRLELELARGPTRPLMLTWLAEGERVEHTTVAASPAAGPAIYAVTPTQPISGRCLALRVDDDGGSELTLRELRAYGDLDREGGLDRVIARLVQEDERAGELVELLQKLGPLAAERLATRWDELSTRSKRRALKVLVLALDREHVRARVTQTAESDDGELAAAAIAALERAGEPGAALLLELATRPGRTGELAVLSLAIHPRHAPALLALLAREQGADRAVLRKALTISARRQRAPFSQAAERFLASDPSPSARAALALVAANVADRELAARAAAQPERAERFEDRYRLALALAEAAPSPDADAWLATQATAAPEWMQRRAAFEALAKRGAEQLPRVAEQLLRDPYPRVRAGVFAALVAGGQGARVTAALADESWPLVRVEAVRALARDAGQRAALENALADGSARVRRAAIEALDQLAHAAAWPAVEARLRTPDEALETREAAVAFARNLCVGAAEDTLLEIARLVLAPETSEEGTRLAIEALRALHELGGAASEKGAAIVKEAGTPELAQLWARLPPARCIAATRS